MLSAITIHFTYHSSLMETILLSMICNYFTGIYSPELNLLVSEVAKTTFMDIQQMENNLDDSNTENQVTNTYGTVMFTLTWINRFSSFH